RSAPSTGPSTGSRAGGILELSRSGHRSRHIHGVGRSRHHSAFGWCGRDRVAATFFQTPPEGPPFEAKGALGTPLDGMLAEQVVLYEDGVVRLPQRFSFEEGACLPCAAVTAWRALMRTGKPIVAGDTVLVLGTGGVSTFALQFAKAAGARVIATSSREDKIER